MIFMINLQYFPAYALQLFHLYIHIFKYARGLLDIAKTGLHLFSERTENKTKKDGQYPLQSEGHSTIWVQKLNDTGLMSASPV